MAWHYDNALTVIDSAGNVLSGRNCLIYSDRAATSQVTTVTLYDGTTVSGGVIPSASDGRVKFAETTQAYKVLYVKAPDGQVYAVFAEEAIASIGSSGAQLNVANTWTAAQTFSVNPVFNDAGIPQAKVSGLVAALAAAANPTYRGTVANSAAMTGLTSAGYGDSCYRTDTASYYFLWGGTDPTVAGNWLQVTGSGSFTPSVAGTFAGDVIYQTGASTVARVTSRTDIMVVWVTTDGIRPVNMTGDDLWVPDLKANFSVYNSTASAYQPVRDSAAAHWLYIQPVSGGPVPNDTNGGAGRKDMDELIVKP